MVKLADFKLVSIPVPFRLSWGKMGYSRHVNIEISDDNGNKGEGEGVLYKTTHLELLPFLERDFPLSPQHLVSFEPALAFAADTALRDLQGKIKKDKMENRAVFREIFLEDRELEIKVKHMLLHKTAGVKLKVGAGVENDKRTISKIRELTQGKLQIYLDANRGYEIEEALKLANWAKKMGVTLFEEPVKGSFALIRKFKEQSNVPVMLDESVQSFKSLEEAINAQCFNVLNIKLSRLGGITLAQKYIQKCQRAGIKIYLGCSEELEIGTRAIFSLAGSIRNLYGVEGFGAERLDRNKGFGYRPGKNSREIFLLKEFVGVWKTRLENVFLRL